VVQINPDQAYDHDVVRRAIYFLQTRSPDLFPFTENFDDARMDAFVKDLRLAIADLTESGSARKTSASGFIVSDKRLHEVIEEWASADGNWPAGTNPGNAFSTLASVRPASE
jgi:hypothetical protein